ncbi:hypothetical protein [Pseudenterobacter timonensis]|uniref:hypothetical protein n=1 Tax=Pseudenterobacter timonensis TaxID=1755099 RepID=UPI002877D287|nr:hypothetical protein [Pseudenterobacter timonensis]
MADAQSPPRTKGFNLNIPFLHEIKTAKLKCSQRFVYARFVGGTFLQVRQDVTVIRTNAASRLVPDGGNDKTNDNYYQFNC